MSFNKGDILYNAEGQIEILEVTDTKYMYKFLHGIGLTNQLSHNVLEDRYKRVPQHESQIILPPDANWTPEESTTKKCTCGISAIGGDIHSDYCDLAEGK